MTDNLIISHFKDSASLKLRIAEALAPSIDAAARRLIDCFQAGHHVLTCGNGGSACDAQHLASELVNRFETQRRALPALALTTDSSVMTSVANDTEYNRIFARQIEAWGRPGDVLVAITTSGQSPNVLEAIKQAVHNGMGVVAFSGRDGGALPQLLGENDVEIRVQAQQTSRIQEVHLLVIHCICALIDAHFQKP